MRRFWTLSLAAAGAVACGVWAVESTRGTETPVKSALMHVVLFNLKGDAPPQAADDLIRDAHQMLAKVPVVTAVHAGRRAPGDRDVHVKDFDVALSLRLKRAGDVQAYLDHPLHVEFAQKHGPDVERIRVVDFYDE